MMRWDFELKAAVSEHEKRNSPQLTAQGATACESAAHSKDSKSELLRQSTSSHELFKTLHSFGSQSVKCEVMMAKNYCFIIVRLHLVVIGNRNGEVRNNKCYDNCVVNCIFDRCLFCSARRFIISEFIKVSLTFRLHRDISCPDSRLLLNPFNDDNFTYRIAREKVKRSSGERKLVEDTHRETRDETNASNTPNFMVDKYFYCFRFERGGECEDLSKVFFAD